MVGRQGSNVGEKDPVFIEVAFSHRVVKYQGTGSRPAVVGHSPPHRRAYSADGQPEFGRAGHHHVVAEVHRGLDHVLVAAPIVPGVGLVAPGSEVKE